MSTYQPDTDNPFGECYASYLRGDALRQWDDMALEEYASCARFRLSCPAWEDDMALRGFVQACESELLRRARDNDPADDRLVISEAQAEGMIDRRVARALPLDHDYHYAEDAEAQAVAEARVVAAVERDVYALYRVDWQSAPTVAPGWRRVVDR